MTWYATERGERTLLCLNQQTLRLTVKKRYEWKSIPRTLWPAASWPKKGIQVTQLSWPDSIVGKRKKSNDWPIDFSAKMPFFCLRNLEKNLQFEDRSQRRHWFTAKLREVSRLQKESLVRDRNQWEKDADSAKLRDVARP